MGLLDDYLNSSSSDTPAKEVKPSSGGLLEQYLNSPSSEAKPKSSASIRPPISGVSSEASDEINAQPVKAGGANPRDQALIESIRNLPSNVGKAIAKDFKEGTEAVGEGVSDVFSGKPATGVGKAGIGLLSSLVSPISGTSREVIAKPVAELTGNEKAGKIAEFALTSGLPVVKAGKATVAALPKNRALKTLVESIGPENAGAVAKAMRENPRLSPADLSPKVKQDVQSLFVNDGPHINYLADRVAQRAEGAKGAVEGAMDASLGSTVNAVDKVNELKQNIKDVGSKEINPALEKTGPVNIKPVVEEIDKILKPGINSVVSNDTALLSTPVKEALENARLWLTDDKNYRIDPKSLNTVQSILRSTAEKMSNSADGQQRLVGQSLMNVRNKIVDAIDAAGDGSYKKGLSNYRDEFHIQDAFEHGHDAIITNSKAITNRPEFFKEWVSKASPEELEAAREGARIAIDTQINGFKHAARRGTDVGEVEFNRQRIEALFGKKEADKLFTTLKHEREIADTNNKITQGSQTAMRSASKAAFEMPTKGDVGKNLLPAAIVEGASILGSGTPGIGTAVYMGMKGATAAKDAIATKLAREHNARYSQYAMPVEGPKRDELIAALEAVANKPAKKSLVRKLSSMVAP